MNSAEFSAMRGAVGARLEEKGEFRRMDGEMASIVQRVGKLEAHSKIIMKLAGIRPDISEREDDIVAFTAKMSTHSFAKATDRLFFDDVMVNAGKAYDKSAREFVTPYPGLYMFALTIRAQYHKKVCAELIGKNLVLARASSGYGGIERATATVTVVVQLNTDDRVYVRQINEEKLGEYHGYGCSVFAGILVGKLK